MRIQRFLKSWAGAAVASAGAVALVTGVVFALRPVAPVLSLGVLYVFAVLPIAIVWGLPWAIGVSIASMLTFNFFFLPPRHTFALRDSENWVALAVYLFTAVVVSELASRARLRATESAYPTGSIFKVITMAAGLEQGGFKPSNTFDCGLDWTGLAGVTHHNWEPQGTLNLTQALTES